MTHDSRRSNTILLIMEEQNLEGEKDREKGFKNKHNKLASVIIIRRAHNKTVKRKYSYQLNECTCHLRSLYNCNILPLRIQNIT